ncbi:MAG: hypothetical protein E7677_01820 [Ruminococcaceae bacterium]|nr:hypothetical protein [Oscillospiraceae bacterium]
MRNALKGKVIIMSVNGKYEYKIEIDTMEDAKNLVAISTKLQGKIILKSGTKFSVNAKSLLGVVLAKRLNWNDLTIVMDNDYYREYQKYIID